MSFLYQKYSVALLDSEGCEIVCRHIGVLAHVAEGESSGLLIVGYIDHSGLAGYFLGKLIDNIVCEIEFLVVFKLHIVNNTVLIHLGFHETLVDGILKVCFIHIGLNEFLNLVLNLGRSLCIGVHNDGVDFTVLSAECNLVVRNCGIIINGIAFVKDFDHIADNHL